MKCYKSDLLTEGKHFFCYKLQILHLILKNWLQKKFKSWVIYVVKTVVMRQLKKKIVATQI